MYTYLVNTTSSIDEMVSIFVDNRIFVRSFESAALEMNGLPSRRVNRNDLPEKGVAFSSALVNGVYA